MISWTNIFSGKFLFTIATAIAFLYAVYTKVLNGEQIYGIIMFVAGAYFFKPSSNGGSNEKTNIDSGTAAGPDVSKG